MEHNKNPIMPKITGNTLFYLEQRETGKIKNKKIFETPFLNEDNDSNEYASEIILEVKAKIIPTNIKQEVVNFLDTLSNSLVDSEILDKFLKENTKYRLKDLEDFDRMKHMTEEQRKKSDEFGRLKI